MLRRAPYVGMFTGIDPRIEVSPEEAEDYPSCRKAIRSPAETKGVGYDATANGGSSCC